ncbi:unnamed protein product [Caenorhabditis bovis]|uniref:Uncharacterized protein n=1 Tax=Caenorhabditis bovis TaxID=2654633 RepID=A0A8S1EFR2_9PELO|nr:unnamed protein product [Caenorhabditis bovis]
MNTWIALLLVSIAFVAALEESEQNYVNELVGAGISEETAKGIVDIGIKHKPDASNPNETGRTIFEAVQRETEEYIKTRSQEDQTAFNQYIAQKKAEFEQPSVIESTA